MITIFDLINEFEILPNQLAKFLWGDLTYCGPDEECHYLTSLTPEQLEALGELIAIKASQKRLEQSELNQMTSAN